MERKVIEWCRMYGRLKRLTEEINHLKIARAALENEIIAHITGSNSEHQMIGKYQASIGYRRRYNFDIPVIRKLLEPRRLFDDVASVRIKQDELTTVIATPGLLTDAEFEDLLNAIQIIEVKEVLHVRKRGLGEIS